MNWPRIQKNGQDSPLEPETVEDLTLQEGFVLLPTDLEGLEAEASVGGLPSSGDAPSDSAEAQPAGGN